MEPITLAEETLRFLTACLFGVALGGVYTLFRLFRLIGLRAVTVACDLLFAVLAAVWSFLLFLRFADGQLRLFLLLGEVLGFAAFYASLGKLLFRLGRLLGRRLSACVRAILRPIRKKRRERREKRGSTQKIERKIQKSPQKILQLYRQRVYTVKRKLGKINGKEEVVREKADSS